MKSELPPSDHANPFIMRLQTDSSFYSRRASRFPPSWARAHPRIGSSTIGHHKHRTNLSTRRGIRLRSSFYSLFPEPFYDLQNLPSPSGGVNLFSRQTHAYFLLPRCY